MKLVSVFNHHLYRSLTRLHQHVSFFFFSQNTETQEFNLPIIQELTWKFLCNPELCFNNQGLNLLKLCPMFLDIKNRVTCGHCRFRKTFFIFKALARTKIVSKDIRANRITDMLQVNSDAIVRFCFQKIEEKWGENCVSENQIQMLDAENNELECLEGEPKPEVASQEIQPLGAQENLPFNEHNFSLNFTNFCEIDKTQMNKVFKIFDGLSHDKRLNCFIRSPANVYGNECYFSYVGTGITKTVELFTRSDKIIDHTGDY